MVCLAVNDPFVMNAFSKETNADNTGIKFVADFDASFTKSLGKETDLSQAGLGVRASVLLCVFVFYFSFSTLYMHLLKLLYFSLTFLFCVFIFFFVFAVLSLCD